MKVLFIGGTGVISSACTALALQRGIELYHLNRGNRAVPDGVITLTADIRNLAEVRNALGKLKFDTVVDWIAFEPSHIKNAVELFADRTGQYVFISSASVYQKPPQIFPVTEAVPAENPFWHYAQQKIACESILRESRMPFTIVRPSHTYDKTKIPLIGGYTTLQRLKHGKPVIVHGDGTSLWTLTHSSDFAPGLIGLLGRSEAIGEIYHITSDEWLPWNNIYRLFGDALGVTPHIIHVPTDVIARHDTEIGDGLLGDKSHSMIFDNFRIRSLVPDFDPRIPFAKGVYEIVQWYSDGPKGETEIPRVHNLMDHLANAYSSAG